MGGPKLVKQIQDGGRLPSWKYINRCISAISGLICTKFSFEIDIRHTRVTGPKITYLKFKIAAAAISNFNFWPYLGRK